MAKKKASKKDLPNAELSDAELAEVAGGTSSGLVTLTVPGDAEPPNNVGSSQEIVSPRDPASGLPTGKRMHKPYSF